LTENTNAVFSMCGGLA